MGNYVVKYCLDEYTIYEDNTCDGKTSTSGDLVVKSKYVSCMKEMMKWYWVKKEQQQIMFF